MTNMNFLSKLLLVLPPLSHALGDDVLDGPQINYTDSFYTGSSIEYRDTSTTQGGGCQCSFPYNLGLVPITPDSSNGGWAMSPNEQCSCSSWCPYACPTGFQSTQWDTEPGASRVNGGFYCTPRGTLEMPRNSEPLCRDLRGEVTMKNIGQQKAHACQTVFPGEESMLIPNALPVDASVQIAIPDQTSYQPPGTPEAAGAHFYVNPQGEPSDMACSWGSKDNGPYGNWAAFVVGTKRGSDGCVFVTLSWNPVYLEWGTPFRTQKPNYGLRITCPGGGCSNEDCAIDPSVHSVNQVSGYSVERRNPDAKGPGQAFCITSVPRGGQAEILVFGV